MEYCSKCANKNIFSYIDGNKRFHCEKCKTIHYQNPKPTATLICMKGHQMLLGRRALSPAKGKWGLIGGFMELNETIQQAAERELYEETNLKGRVHEFVGICSHFNTVFGDVMLIGMTMEIEDWSLLKAGDDVSEVQFFNISTLPELAFESHKKLVNIFRQKTSNS